MRRLPLLRDASLRSQPRCDVWIPLSEDYGGVNDRHALMSRAAADSYLSRFEAVLPNVRFSRNLKAQ